VAGPAGTAGQQYHARRSFSALTWQMDSPVRLAREYAEPARGQRPKSEEVVSAAV